MSEIPFRQKNRVELVEKQTLAEKRKHWQKIEKKIRNKRKSAGALREKKRKENENKKVKKRSKTCEEKSERKHRKRWHPGGEQTNQIDVRKQENKCLHSSTLKRNGELNESGCEDLEGGEMERKRKSEFIENMPKTRLSSGVFMKFRDGAYAEMVRDVLFVFEKEEGARFGRGEKVQKCASCGWYD